MIGNPEAVISTTLHAQGTKGAIRKEARFDTGVGDLWTALTEPDRLARWMAKVEGDLRVGGEFFASFRSMYEAPGRVDKCVPQSRLVVTFEPGTPNENTMSFHLVADGNQTRLVVEHIGLPADDVLRNYAAGWHSHLDDLARLIVGQEPGDWQAHWEELKPQYEGLTITKA